MNSFGLTSAQHTQIQQRCNGLFAEYGNTVYSDLFTHKSSSWFSQRKNMQIFLRVVSSQMKMGIPVYEALQQFAATLQPFDPVGAIEMEKMCKELEQGSLDVITLRIAEYSKMLAQRLHLMRHVGSFTDAFAKLLHEVQNNPHKWENG